MGKIKMFAIGVILLSCLVGTYAIAAMPDDTVLPAYTHTDVITVYLAFDGDYAICEGTVTPKPSYAASLTLTLYQLVDARWVYVASWSGSAPNGIMAVATGEVVVEDGTYKAVVSGNVSDLEYPTKSIIRTK